MYISLLNIVPFFIEIMPFSLELVPFFSASLVPYWWLVPCLFFFFLELNLLMLLKAANFFILRIFCYTCELETRESLCSFILVGDFFFFSRCSWQWNNLKYFLCSTIIFCYNISIYGSFFFLLMRSTIELSGASY